MAYICRVERDGEKFGGGGKWEGVGEILAG